MAGAHHEFSFFAVCESVSRDEGAVSLHGIFTTLTVPKGELPGDLDCVIAVSGIILPPKWGKRLDLMAFRLAPGGKRETLAGYRGTPLILPEVTGAQVCTWPIALPLWNAGFYGLDLWDRDGAFGPPHDPEGDDSQPAFLASTLFAVTEEGE